MPNHGARTGRRTLASASWLLLLAGLSCKYNVTLPWVPDGARAPMADSSFDQSPPPFPDTPLSGPDGPGPDGPVCTGDKYQEWPLNADQVQILVAIDRSNSMLREFDSTIPKSQAAWAALNTSAESHPRILFATSFFPWTSCGTMSCCAGYFLPPNFLPGPADASSGCVPSDPGCLPASNDSPSHKALQMAGTYINSDKGSGHWEVHKFILVLITDQAPSCAGDSSPASPPCSSAIDEARKLGNQGVQTFVLFPSADGRSAPECLSNIARQNAQFFYDSQQLYVAKNSQDLSNRLEEIVYPIEKRLCRFSVGTATIDQIVRVKIGKDFPSRDDGGRAGWAWDSASGEIVLTGDACTKILSSAKYPEVKIGVCVAGNGPGSYGGP